MTREQIKKRLKEIRTLCENPNADPSTDFNALEEEVRSLNEQLAALDQAAERRERILCAVTGGAGTTLRSFAPMPQPGSWAPDSQEYRSAYLRQLQGRELIAEERTALKAANAVIPTITMNLIVHRLEQNPMLAAIDLSYIPGNISFPVASSVNDASWVSLGSASTDSEDIVTRVSLAAYMIVKTVEIQADVSNMAIDAFESWLVAQLANRLETCVDKSVFTGTGTNQATGLLKEGEITNTGAFTKAGMTYKDLMTIIGSVPSRYLAHASFAMPRTLFFQDVLGMTTEDGKPVVVADPQAPAVYKILGFPVQIDDNCTADTLVFGDMKQYKFNFAKAPTVEADDSVGFRSGSRVWRAMALGDGKVADKSAFAVYKRANT